MSAPGQDTSVARARLRQLPALLRPLVGALRWQPSIGAAALTALLIAWQADAMHDQSDALRALRGVTVVLALGAAFLLDDPAADTLAASPTSLAWRRSTRLAAATLLVGLPWTGAVLTAQIRGADLPVARLTLELAAMVTLALAGAAGLTRWADAREPGVLAVPLVAGMTLALFRVPERWALLVYPGPEWGPAHQRWALVLGLAVCLLLACNQDPARSSRAGSQRRSHQEAGPSPAGAGTPKPVTAGRRPQTR